MLMKKQIFVAYDWRIVVIEKFLILHYVEDAASKLVMLECYVIITHVIHGDSSYVIELLL